MGPLSEILKLAADLDTFSAAMPGGRQVLYRCIGRMRVLLPACQIGANVWRPTSVVFCLPYCHLGELVYTCCRPFFTPRSLGTGQRVKIFAKSLHRHTVYHCEVG